MKLIKIWLTRYICCPNVIADPNNSQNIFIKNPNMLFTAESWIFLKKFHNLLHMHIDTKYMNTYMYTARA